MVRGRDEGGPECQWMDHGEIQACASPAKKISKWLLQPAWNNDNAIVPPRIPPSPWPRIDQITHEQEAV